MTHAEATKLVADLARELNAAHIIIEQLEQLRREAHLHRSFNLRGGARRDLLGFAKQELQDHEG